MRFQLHGVDEQVRHEGPVFNRPGRKAGMEKGQKMSAESAALSWTEQSMSIANACCMRGMALCRTFGAHFGYLYFPARRPGLLNAGPSGLLYRMIPPRS
jgi:hypothetical protein